MHQIEFEIPPVSLLELLGPEGRLVSELEKKFPAVTIKNRGHIFKIEGDETQARAASRLLLELADMVQAGHQPDAVTARDSARMLLEDEAAAPAALLNASYIRTPGKSIRAKTEGQQRYLAAIEENTIVMGIGPAGTGKTYLAVAKAVESLYAKKVGRIVLTRPVVEAGERLGFLPGTLSEKIDPYLRPLFDALQEMLGAENTAKLVETGVIELAPLAYMRGRTLSDAFVILDEAQNTTVEQMKMFLTRLGANSKMVITGDITQVDLPGGKSGLVHAVGILEELEGLAIAELTSSDVVRHDMVARIVEAYDRSGS